MTETDEVARVRAFGSRHPATGGPEPAPPPTGWAAVKLQMRQAAKLSEESLKRVASLLPPAVRNGPTGESAREAVRWLRETWRRRPPSAPIPLFVDDRPAPETADEARARSAARHGRPAASSPSASAAERPRVAALIWTRNAAEHLANLFDSLKRAERYPALELWVVDHGSADETREVVDQNQDRFDIRTIWLSETRSFSESINRAARETQAPLLLLLSNRIVFSTAVIGRMVDELKDPHVGIVGLTLCYPADHPDHPNGLQHAGIKLYADGELPLLRPYRLSAFRGLSNDRPPETGSSVESVPAVCIASALVRRKDFLAVGGLDEGYHFGLEDLDLALRYRRRLGLSSVVIRYASAIFDELPTGRRGLAPDARARLQANQRRLVAHHGRALKQAYLRDKRRGGLFYSDEPLVVAFAVSRVDARAEAEDLQVANGLRRALEAECGWRTMVVPLAGDAGYHLDGVDVVIVLSPAYDPRNIRCARPHLLRIAWIRDRVSRWSRNPGFLRYDAILSTSLRGAHHLWTNEGRAVEVLRPAARLELSEEAAPDDRFMVDVAFIGHRWGDPHRIEEVLHPEMIVGSVALYGRGWAEHPTLGAWAKEPVAVSQRAAVYASARIVICDARSDERALASLRGEVFDALAAGALVVTNNAAGSIEAFDPPLPTYGSAEELTSIVNGYLRNEDLRRARVDTLREVVRERHTYRHRAIALSEILRRFEDPRENCSLAAVPNGRDSTTEDATPARSKTRAVRIEAEPVRRRVGIKVPVPSAAHAYSWGDYHFGHALMRSLQKMGHAARIELVPDWTTPPGFFDDVVISLRGLYRYEPSPHQASVLWNISHPEAVTDDEYTSYDTVFVASIPYAATLSDRLGKKVEPLLQCTDPSLFYVDPTGPRHEALFVGNSRRQQRPVVMDAIAADLPLAVYGRLWSDLIDRRYIRGDHVPNARLRQFYSSATVVLNDHWPEMRDLSFLSNRLFDAVASGAPVVSDPVEGLQDIFGDAVRTYVTVDELRSVFEQHIANPEPWREAALAAAERIRREHSFDARAKVIMEAAEVVLRQKR